jgi:hypothetical protein
MGFWGEPRATAPVVPMHPRDSTPAPATAAHLSALPASPLCAVLTDARRPNLLDTLGCSDLELADVSFLNAPQYNAFLMQTTGCFVHGVTVMVDIEDQLDVYSYVGAFRDAQDEREGEDAASRAARHRRDATGGAAQRERAGRVLRAAGKIGPTDEAQLAEVRAATRRSPAEQQVARMSLLPARLSAESWFDEAWRVRPPFPMIYALNTDGIDISGTDIHVRNCTITNFDDTVCPKPQLNCTRNFLIEDIDVTYGVGVSMGSVPPDVGNDCISGVLARRLHFTTPLKAI